MFRALKRLFRPDPPAYRPNPYFQSGRVIRTDKNWFHDPNDFKHLKDKTNAISHSVAGRGRSS